MGACSSKPKTTESMEPTEKSQVKLLEANNVAEDAALKGCSERSSTQSLMGEGLAAKRTPHTVQDNEVQQKEAIVGAEEVQKERESMAVAVEELLKEGILSSDEAVSASAGWGGEGKVGDGVAAEGEASKEEAAIADEDADVSGMQDYVKPLALDDGQSAAELHSTDAAPVSGRTAAESTASAYFVPSSTEEEKVSEVPSVVQPAVSSGIATSDVKKAHISEKETEPSSGLTSAAVPYLPEESTIEAGYTIADEGQQGGSTMDPLPAAIEEDRVSEESGAVGTLEDYIVAPAVAADNESVSEPQAEAMTDASIVEKTSETYAEITTEESITRCTLQAEPLAETKSGESIAESQAESETYAESIVELQPEVPTPDKGIAEDKGVIAETFVEPQGETTADELIASIASAQVQTAAMATPDEAIAEPHAEITTEESTVEPQVEASPAADVKSETGPEAVELCTDQVNNASSEGQLTFEDASDVPLLMAESSTSEPQVPEEPSISENA